MQVINERVRDESKLIGGLGALLLLLTLMVDEQEELLATVLLMTDTGFYFLLLGAWLYITHTVSGINLTGSLLIFLGGYIPVISFLPGISFEAVGLPVPDWVVFTTFALTAVGCLVILAGGTVCFVSEVRETETRRKR